MIVQFFYIVFHQYVYSLEKVFKTFLFFFQDCWLLKTSETSKSSVDFNNSTWKKDDRKVISTNLGSTKIAQDSHPIQIKMKSSILGDEQWCRTRDVSSTLFTFPEFVLTLYKLVAFYTLCEKLVNFKNSTGLL